jgi:hypothetical protein
MSLGYLRAIAPLSRSLQHFQRINLYFEVEISTVRRLTSLCTSLLDSKLGNLIRTLAIKLTIKEMHSKEEAVITEALVRLAELVPDKFTDTLYSQAIEVIYEGFMKRRLDDHLEELGEDYFDDEVEEWIDQTNWDNVATFYEYETEQLVCGLFYDELDRSRREDGEQISNEEAALRVHDAFEEVEEDRRNSADAIIEAERADEDLMSALRAQVVKDDTEMFKRALVENERQRARRIIENDEGEELREEATSLVDERFFGSSS